MPPHSMSTLIVESEFCCLKKKLRVCAMLLLHDNMNVADSGFMLVIVTWICSVQKKRLFAAEMDQAALILLWPWQLASYIPS